MLSSQFSDSKNKTKRLVLIALFSAIIVVMSFVPYTGYIGYGGISITTLHIPVIIGAALWGPKDGFILGTVWGITCLLRAFLSGSFEAVIFLNPLISVVPRMIMGYVTGLFSQIIKKHIENINVWLILTALVGTLTNTVLVLTAIGLFAGDSVIPLGDTIKTIFTIIISINGLIEICLSVFLVPAIGRVIIKYANE